MLPSPAQQSKTTTAVRSCRHSRRRFKTDATCQHDNSLATKAT